MNPSHLSHTEQDEDASKRKQHCSEPFGLALLLFDGVADEDSVLVQG